jgi:hypothetical protein
MTKYVIVTAISSQRMRYCIPVYRENASGYRTPFENRD